MTGGTLLVSRHEKLLSHYKKRLEVLGFNDVSITSADKDGLNFVIDEIKPHLVIIGAGFYAGSTPYMMVYLLRAFPKLNIAAVSLSDYPADLGMWFIANGARSFITALDGAEQFYMGLERIRNGGKFISESVQERIEMRREIPACAGTLTDRSKEVILLICNGFKDDEIGDILGISRKTVTNHKTEIFKNLNVRTPNELIRAAQRLEIVKQEGMIFYPNNFVLSPLPEEKIMKRRKE